MRKSEAAAVGLPNLHLPFTSASFRTDMMGTGSEPSSTPLAFPSGEVITKGGIMRVPHLRSVNERRCRRAANCRRMRHGLQVRSLLMRRRTSQVSERKQYKPGRAMPDFCPRSLDWPSVWMPSECGLTMMALTQVLSQYLRGDPLWDGARTVASMRRLVADEWMRCPMRNSKTD